MWRTVSLEHPCGVFSNVIRFKDQNSAQERSACPCGVRKSIIFILKSLNFFYLSFIKIFGTTFQNVLNKRNGEDPNSWCAVSLKRSKFSFKLD
jgi:hypothetical protein